MFGLSFFSMEFVPVILTNKEGVGLFG